MVFTWSEQIHPALSRIRDFPVPSMSTLSRVSRSAVCPAARSLPNLRHVSGLGELDLALFRWVNQTCAHPALDAVMYLLSGEYWMWLLVAVAGVWGAMKGGRRLRCFLLAMAVIFLVGEGLITGPLKKLTRRPRPFVTQLETRLPPGIGKGASFSLPSGHAAAMAAVAMTAGLFFPRSRRILFPVAAGVGVSRIYNGVHYPSDVLAGWAVGAGYALGISHGMRWIWRAVGRRWFPHWWVRLPDLLKPESPLAAEQIRALNVDLSPALQPVQWLRLGYVLIGLLMVGRWGYQAAHVIDLSEDEAYQWLWSKRLDWSYYSKPPGIALAQRFGTMIAGDTELGVRFLSPLISAVVSWMTLRFVSRFVAAPTAFWSLVAFLAVPLFALGGILLTVDPLTVFFWTLAMFAGWRAVLEDSTRQWLLVGVGVAGTFLCKYFSPFLIAAFALVFLTWPRARRQLRRPGPWLALGANVLALLPFLWWNKQHNWVGLTHLSERGALKESWRFTLRFFNDFMVVEPVLFNPFFFVAVIVAVVLFCRRPGRFETVTERDPDGTVLRYLLTMGAPIFLFYLAWTFRGRVQPNWIAPAVLPLLLFALILGSRVPRESGAGRWLGYLFRTGLAVFTPVLILAHETNWVSKIAGRPLPAHIDPLRRTRGFRETAALVQAQFDQVARPGQPTYILCHHYGYAGELSFYVPAARARVGSADPLVYVRRFDIPNNQLWFWPEYEYRTKKGADFLLVFQSDEPVVMPVDELKSQFNQLEDLGEFPVLYRGREFHRLRLFVGRGLR